MSCLHVQSQYDFFSYFRCNEESIHHSTTDFKSCCASNQRSHGWFGVILERCGLWWRGYPGMHDFKSYFSSIEYSLCCEISGLTRDKKEPLLLSAVWFVVIRQIQMEEKDVTICRRALSHGKFACLQLLLLYTISSRKGHRLSIHSADLKGQLKLKKTLLRPRRRLWPSARFQVRAYWVSQYRKGALSSPSLARFEVMVQAMLTMIWSHASETLARFHVALWRRVDEQQHSKSAVSNDLMS